MLKNDGVFLKRPLKCEKYQPFDKREKTLKTAFFKEKFHVQTLYKRGGHFFDEKQRFGMLFKITASRFGIGRFPKLSKNATNFIEKNDNYKIQINLIFQYLQT